MLQWFTLGVRPNRERKVAEALDDMMFASYAPKCIVKSVRDGKVVQRKVLLFSGYVFVKLDLEKIGWQRARYVRGATTLLPHGHVLPAPLPARFVESIRRELNAEEYTIDQCWERVKGYAPGDTVKVLDGLLIEQEGKFVAYQAGFVTLLFALLGKPNAIEIPAQHVAPAPQRAAVAVR